MEYPFLSIGIKKVKYREKQIEATGLDRLLLSPMSNMGLASKQTDEQTIRRKWKGVLKMNKSDLINEVAKVLNTKSDAQAAVDSVFAAITQALKAKDTVTIIGFGTFKVGNRAARTGRNPKTGEAIEISARNVPKFVAGKALKNAVN